MTLNRYRSQYERLHFYWIGWSWGYAAMIIKDSNDEYKIRLAKCVKNWDFPKTKMYEWEEVNPSEVFNLDQRCTINFKTDWEIEACFEMIIVLHELLVKLRNK